MLVKNPSSMHVISPVVLLLGNPLGVPHALSPVLPVPAAGSAVPLVAPVLDHLDPDEQAVVLAMIEGALLRHQVRQIGVTQPTAS
jgi:hypothetical protein